VICFKHDYRFIHSIAGTAGSLHARVASAQDAEDVLRGRRRIIREEGGSREERCADRGNEERGEIQ
jgi:hypothetical protein